MHVLETPDMRRQEGLPFRSIMDRITFLLHVFLRKAQARCSWLFFSMVPSSLGDEVTYRTFRGAFRHWWNLKRILLQSKAWKSFLTVITTNGTLQSMPTGAPPWRGKAVDYSQIYVLCLWQHPFVSYSGRGIVKEEAGADLKPRTQICKKKHNISGVLNFYCEPCGEDWWLETADCFPNIYSSFSSGQIFYPEWQWAQWKGNISQRHLKPTAAM